MNPYEVLGVTVDASETDIRAAYLRKVKEFPPEQSPEKFEEIRDAFETLGNPRLRAKSALLSSAFMGPLVTLVDKQASKRAFVGPKLWLEVLKTQ